MIVRASRLHSLALAFAFACVALAGCSPAPIVETPTQTVEVPSASPAAEATCVVTDRSPALAAVASSPPVPLATLVGAARRDRRAGGLPVIDLGHLALQERAHRQESIIDVSLRSLPYEVVRPDLPAAVARLWDRDEATLKDLEAALSGRRRIDEAKGACEKASCADAACLGSSLRRADLEVAGLRARFKAERAELVMVLRREVPHGKPGLLLALGRMLDEGGRTAATEPEELRQALSEPLTLYEAAYLGASDPEIQWYARYFRAAALDDTNAMKDARTQYDALARMAAPPSRTAEVLYRSAVLERDLASAAALYKQATATAPPKDTIRRVAAERWAWNALAADEFADAVAAGVVFFEEAAQSEPPALLQVEPVLAPLAIAIGHVSSQSSQPIAGAVPGSVFPALARHVAEDAVRRFDVALAESAWEASRARAAGSPEAQRAADGLAAIEARKKQKTDARAELSARLGALFGECAGDRHPPFGPVEIALTVTLRDAQPAKITARAAPTTAEPVASCIVARGAAFFVDAPGGIRATVTLSPR